MEEHKAISYYYYYIPDCKPQLGELEAKKPEGPSREDSPVRKEKILEWKQNNNKTKQRKKAPAGKSAL